MAEGDTDKVALYDYLDEQVKKLNTNIELYQFSTPLVEFQRVLQYYYDDHPETYWLSRGYSYMYYDQGGVRYVYSMGQNYAYTASQIAQYQKQLDARAAELLEGITDAMPQVQREQLVHDRLITSSKYDLSLSADHTHDLIGVMLNGTGVCESYSRAFQYLMYRCGIPVALVTGVTESGESHMWNAVKIDGNWYQVDVTWDDPVFDDPKPDYIEYTYFNLTDTEMFSVRTKTVTYSQTNSSYQISYPTPPCTATAASYVKMNVVELSSFDAALIGETIAQSVKNNSMAVFKPIGQYTMAQLKADVGTSAKYWLIVSVANEHLGSAQQLTNPGYILKENTYHNALLVWMRNV